MRKLIAGALLAASVGAFAQTQVHIGISGVTGSAFMQWSHRSRSDYVNGLVDGMLYAPALANANLPFLDHIEDCFVAMHPTHGQLTSIVDQYLRTHPVLTGYEMHSLTYWSLRDACAQLGKPL
ncbi:hypothetical protein ACFQ3P_38575 [Paraburkholderia sabiae]|uniref:Uncharacterized protein n=1 Tax=Paraburkholderia sabiae TaxID=273251 RepID=A0ABU9QPS7_9BURK|nr:hypothetical protein [Paraburkholderia sabiae]WJZ74383.1 hypothetical protein QEN71_00780 [Paraburkholderia sabiae]CAD6562655.1 hypothetical protein LMG24235_07894 [Paraburkholderia sabiae]